MKGKHFSWWFIQDVGGRGCEAVWRVGVGLWLQGKMKANRRKPALFSFTLKCTTSTESDTSKWWHAVFWTLREQDEYTNRDLSLLINTSAGMLVAMEMVSQCVISKWYRNNNTGAPCVCGAEQAAGYFSVVRRTGVWRLSVNAGRRKCCFGPREFQSSHV